MSVVWDLGECSSAEVIAAFVRKRKLANTTIRTVLTNLRTKGYVETVPSTERGFRFRPAVSRERVVRRTLTELVDGLLGGAPGQAIAYLIRDSEVDEEELTEIQRLLDERRRQRTEG